MCTLSLMQHLDTQGCLYSLATIFCDGNNGCYYCSGHSVLLTFLICPNYILGKHFMQDWKGYLTRDCWKHRHALHVSCISEFLHLLWSHSVQCWVNWMQAKDHTLPLRLPAVDRLVAIGDLHGDFNKTQRAFRLAGLIDEADHWCGGTTTAVQVLETLMLPLGTIWSIYMLLFWVLDTYAASLQDDGFWYEDPQRDPISFFESRKSVFHYENDHSGFMLNRPYPKCNWCASNGELQMSCA